MPELFLMMSTFQNVFLFYLGISATYFFTMLKNIYLDRVF